MDTPVLPLSRIEAVVIGASAGGVDALLSLLTALPAGFRPAVLVVIHVPPDQPSGIAALLDQRCALPVTEALDKQPVPPGAVVFAPPNYHLLVEPTRTLALSIDAPVRYSRPAIDPLFESASIAYGAQLLALLLTGGSDDGSEGLAAVRARGGTAWVQDPDTAVASTMPAAGIASAGADAVLSIERMALSLAAVS
ncbi:chemotaxis protein CheB [Piscinibacter gummiphilus]|uniref:protein-glutamate methylesterase n=1 Tax=Piscinibacter gummiphilus TaxID=946333 RepID=A0A1W6L9U4_9BURK|nr:chemotaxis protein CheB [Piscinibacter gummiphilus]ARN21012.1 chemotaxis protein CheB [Piscinibacter gummiphilus]ATU65687.1 chemotaxis protein CheB [Piscinibacter gummiphilus]GLS93549.1 chemotaxis protein CheB [Piscinibacter gummiphilus]